MLVSINSIFTKSMLISISCIFTKSTYLVIEENHGCNHSSSIVVTIEFKLQKKEKERKSPIFLTTFTSIELVSFSSVNRFCSYLQLRDL